MAKTKTCKVCRAEREGKVCGACGHEEKRGSGDHSKAGRKKNVPEANDVKFGKGFATRVFARIKELNLKAANGKEIKSAEDMALNLLVTQDAGAKAFFKDLLLWQLGKPVQPTITADTRETQAALERGNLPSHFESSPAHPRRVN
jgi:hypothetical protein